MSLPSRIYLMGVKHSGKSTLGELLAERLDRAFLDLDTTIMDLYARDSFGPPASVREIYEQLGPAGFQELEAEAAAVIAHPATLRTPDVVALGGGTIDNKPAMQRLADTGIFLYLLQNEEVLFRRIVRRGIPPFLQGDDPRAAFAELFRRRDAAYRARADQIVDIQTLDPTASVELLVQTIQG
ncbi:MAG: shikimate kinase [Spirochaetaceae bacterium]|nr:MAG: shikimate kinase [Spirochaetaceae bacterium]